MKLKLHCCENWYSICSLKLQWEKKFNKTKNYKINCRYKISYISLLMIWAQGLLNLLVTLLINLKLCSLQQNRSGTKVDLFGSKRNTSLANSLLLFRSREARFWTRFWSSTEERSHLKTEERRAMVAKI